MTERETPLLVSITTRERFALHVFKVTRFALENCARLPRNYDAPDRAVTVYFQLGESLFVSKFASKEQILEFFC